MVKLGILVQSQDMRKTLDGVTYDKQSSSAKRS